VLGAVTRSDTYRHSLNYSTTSSSLHHLLCLCTLLLLVTAFAFQVALKKKFMVHQIPLKIACRNSSIDGEYHESRREMMSTADYTTCLVHQNTIG